MPHPDTAIVTGAFSYTGRYVAGRLLAEGVSVRTLTNRPVQDDPFGGQVPAVPLDFSGPDGLCRSMRGTGVLYNTYWVRFGRGRTTFDQAVENSKQLFDVAARAGCGQDSPLLSGQRNVRVQAALLPGQEAGGGDIGVSPTPSSGPPWSSVRATCC